MNYQIFEILDHNKILGFVINGKEWKVRLKNCVGTHFS